MAQRGGGERWEHSALRWLSYPANLAFAGIAAFLLAIPVVTWLAAAVACGRALDSWLRDGDDRVFTNTFRELGRTWRRSLPMSVAATVVVGVLAVDWVFLSNRGGAWATTLAAAMLPVAAVLLMIATYLPAASAVDRDAGSRRWLRHAASLMFLSPLRSIGLLVVVVTWLVLCLVVPTIFPFLGLSVPAFLGLLSARSALDRAST